MKKIREKNPEKRGYSFVTQDKIKVDGVLFDLKLEQGIEVLEKGGRKWRKKWIRKVEGENRIKKNEEREARKERNIKKRRKEKKAELKN